jgi:hypothetical protein
MEVVIIPSRPNLCEGFDERRHNLVHLGWAMEPGGKITVTGKRALKLGGLRVLQLSESSLDPLYLVRSLLPLT